MNETIETPNVIYNKAKESLGYHLTLDDSVPEDVGCAEAVSDILLKSGVQGIPQRGFAGTYDLCQWLAHNSQFEEINKPEDGAVIIAPTQPTNPSNHGHTGICLKYGIGSNDSNTGLFKENYTFDSWNKSFQARGLITRYFRLKG